MGREAPALTAQVLGRQVHGMFPFSRNAQGREPLALILNRTCGPAT